MSSSLIGTEAHNRERQEGSHIVAVTEHYFLCCCLFVLLLKLMRRCGRPIIPSLTLPFFHFFTAYHCLSSQTNQYV